MRAQSGSLINIHLLIDRRDCAALREATRKNCTSQPELRHSDVSDWNANIVVHGQVSRGNIGFNKVKPVSLLAQLLRAINMLMRSSEKTQARK